MEQILSDCGYAADATPLEGADLWLALKIGELRRKSHAEPISTLSVDNVVQKTMRWVREQMGTDT